MGTTFSAPSDGSVDSEDKDGGKESPVQGDAENKEKAPTPAIDTSLLPKELTSKYEVLVKIGSGSFGSVYKVRDKKTRVLYAAKYVEDKANDASEVRIQAKMDDIHVVKIFDTVTIPSLKRMVIVMEYCEGGNLLQWIKRNRRHQLLNERLVLKILKEICEAVYNCHQKKIIHRDLKPENVLMDGKRQIKLADFGVARVLHSRSVAKSFCGTPPYMAPELFLSYLSRGGGRQKMQGSIGYDDKCDVWSIGCILWDMANKSNCFVHELSSSVGLNVAQAASDSIGVREVNDLIDTDIPTDYVLTKRLLRGMLVKDPNHRISLSEILQDRELRELFENPLDSHWFDAI